MMPNPVETPRLILRCVEARDGEAFTRLITPELSRRLGAWPAPFTAELAERKVTASRQAAEAGELLPFVITRRSDGDVLGWLAIGRKEGEPARGVLSYWLGTAFHRQGILCEAGTAALDAAFTSFGLTSMEATVHPDNPASAATLLSLGFRHYQDGTIWAESRQARESCHYFERELP